MICHVTMIDSDTADDDSSDDGALGFCDLDIDTKDTDRDDKSKYATMEEHLILTPCEVSSTSD